MKTRKLLAVLLTLAMTLSLLPTAAFAAAATNLSTLTLDEGEKAYILTGATEDGESAAEYAVDKLVTDPIVVKSGKVSLALTKGVTVGATESDYTAAITVLDGAELTLTGAGDVTLSGTGAALEIRGSGKAAVQATGEFTSTKGDVIVNAGTLEFSAGPAVVSTTAAGTSAVKSTGTTTIESGKFVGALTPSGSGTIQVTAGLFDAPIDAAVIKSGSVVIDKTDATYKYEATTTDANNYKVTVRNGENGGPVYYKTVSDNDSGATSAIEAAGTLAQAATENIAYVRLLDQADATSIIYNAALEVPAGVVLEADMETMLTVLASNTLTFKHGSGLRVNQGDDETPDWRYYIGTADMGAAYQWDGTAQGSEAMTFSANDGLKLVNSVSVKIPTGKHVTTHLYDNDSNQAVTYKLTIEDGSTLTVDGSTEEQGVTYGLRIAGTTDALTVAGTLKLNAPLIIDETATVEVSGTLTAEANVTNNGTLKISKAMTVGSETGGTLTNNGTISVVSGDTGLTIGAEGTLVNNKDITVGGDAAGKLKISGTARNVKNSEGADGKIIVDKSTGAGELTIDTGKTIQNGGLVVVKTDATFGTGDGTIDLADGGTAYINDSADNNSTHVSNYLAMETSEYADTYSSGYKGYKQALAKFEVDAADAKAASGTLTVIGKKDIAYLINSSDEAATYDAATWTVVTVADATKAIEKLVAEASDPADATEIVVTSSAPAYIHIVDVTGNATDGYTAGSATQTITITRAATTGSVSEANADSAADKGKMTVAETQEYSADQSAWTKGSGSQADFVAGTYYVRTAGTGTVLASAATKIVLKHYVSTIEVSVPELTDAAFTQGATVPTLAAPGITAVTPSGVTLTATAVIGTGGSGSWSGKTAGSDTFDNNKTYLKLTLTNEAADAVYASTLAVTVTAGDNKTYEDGTATVTGSDVYVDLGTPNGSNVIQALNISIPTAAASEAKTPKTFASTAHNDSTLGVIKVTENATLTTATAAGNELDNSRIASATATWASKARGATSFSGDLSNFLDADTPAEYQLTLVLTPEGGYTFDSARFTGTANDYLTVTYGDTADGLTATVTSATVGSDGKLTIELTVDNLAYKAGTLEADVDYLTIPGGLSGAASTLENFYGDNGITLTNESTQRQYTVNADTLGNFTFSLQAETGGGTAGSVANGDIAWTNLPTVTGSASIPAGTKIGTLTIKHNSTEAEGKIELRTGAVYPGLTAITLGEIAAPVVGQMVPTLTPPTVKTTTDGTTPRGEGQNVTTTGVTVTNAKWVKQVTENGTTKYVDIPETDEGKFVAGTYGVLLTLEIADPATAGAVFKDDATVNIGTNGAAALYTQANTGTQKGVLGVNTTAQLANTTLTGVYQFTALDSYNITLTLQDSKGTTLDGDIAKNATVTMKLVKDAKEVAIDGQSEITLNYKGSSQFTTEAVTGDATIAAKDATAKLPAYGFYEVVVTIDDETDATKYRTTSYDGTSKANDDSTLALVEIDGTAVSNGKNVKVMPVEYTLTLKGLTNITATSKTNLVGSDADNPTPYAPGQEDGTYTQKFSVDSNDITLPTNGESATQITEANRTLKGWTDDSVTDPATNTITRVDVSETQKNVSATAVWASSVATGTITAAYGVDESDPTAAKSINLALNTAAYTGTVPNATDETKTVVTFTPDDTTNGVKSVAYSVSSGSSGDATTEDNGKTWTFALANDDFGKEITITVTAKDDSASKTYTLTLTEAASGSYVITYKEQFDDEQVTNATDAGYTKTTYASTDAGSSTAIEIAIPSSGKYNDYTAKSASASFADGKSANVTWDSDNSVWKLAVPAGATGDAVITFVYASNDVGITGGKLGDNAFKQETADSTTSIGGDTVDNVPAFSVILYGADQDDLTLTMTGKTAKYLTQTDAPASFEGSNVKTYTEGSTTLGAGTHWFKVVANDDTTVKYYKLTVTRMVKVTYDINYTNADPASVTVWQEYNKQFALPDISNYATSYTDTSGTSVTINANTAGTLTGWSDGTNTYDGGDYVKFTADETTLTAQWTASTNTLTGLSLSAGSAISFSSSTSYTVNDIPYASETVTVTATGPADIESVAIGTLNSEAVVNGETQGDGSVKWTSAPIALEVNTQKDINVIVTAGDGTTKTYKIEATRKQDDDATLKSVVLTTGGVEVAATVGEKDTTNDGQSNANAVPVTVTLPKAANNDVTIVITANSTVANKIEYVKSTDGSTGTINQTTGWDDVTKTVTISNQNLPKGGYYLIKVTAQDTSKTLIYLLTVDVNGTASSNATISAATITSEKDDVLDTEILDADEETVETAMTAKVHEGADDVVVTLTVDKYATVEHGTTNEYGKTADNEGGTVTIELEEVPETLYIKVTAEDGLTEKEYTVAFTTVKVLPTDAPAITTAPLVDQDSGEAVNPTPYTAVPGEYDAETKTTPVTVTATNLAKHQAADMGNTVAYWVGVAVKANADFTTTYAWGFGNYDVDSADFKAAPRTWENSGTTYNTFYFACDSQEEWTEDNTGYIAVKYVNDAGEDVTFVYELTFVVTVADEPDVDTPLTITYGAGVTEARVTENKDGKTITVSAQEGEAVLAVGYTTTAADGKYTAVSGTGDDGAYVFDFTAHANEEGFQIGIVLKGDANQSGAVDTRDATVIERYSFNENLSEGEEKISNGTLTALGELAAKVNSDDAIDGRDATVIERYDFNKSLSEGEAKISNGEINW